MDGQIACGSIDAASLTCHSVGGVVLIPLPSGMIAIGDWSHEGSVKTIEIKAIVERPSWMKTSQGYK